MCIFSQAVDSVSETNIFARAAPDGRQYLAYSMTLSAVGDMAMILPLPVPPGVREDAVKFIDLSGYIFGYRRLFEDLAKGFHEPEQVVKFWLAATAKPKSLSQ